MALGLEDSAPIYKVMVEKWMLQCVAVAYNDGTRSFENVLTLVGRQGIGKTSFFRALVPQKQRFEWFKEGVSINMDSTDSKCIATSGWITELGEVDGMLKREQTELKAFLSNPSDTYRAPYAPAAITKPRWTVFGATVNSETFLCDQTGNRRWWTVRVDNMDADIARALVVCIDQIWAQFKAMWDTAVQEGRSGDCFRLNEEENRELESLNMEHTSSDPLRTLLNDALVWDMDHSLWEDITSTQLLQKLGIENTRDKRNMLNIFREEMSRRGIKAKRPGNRETWHLPRINGTISYKSNW